MQHRGVLRPQLNGHLQLVTAKQKHTHTHLNIRLRPSSQLISNTCYMNPPSVLSGQINIKKNIMSHLWPLNMLIKPSLGADIKPTSPRPERPVWRDRTQTCRGFA